jgi:hypothetical protein
MRISNMDDPTVVVKTGDNLMSVLSSNRWPRRLALALVAALSIGAMAVPSAPAQARVFVSLGIGAPVGWGYYAPPPYYGYPYYRPYYRAYYGYPGFFIGRGVGPYRHWHR